MQDQNSPDMYRHVFDAFPAPVFVVDQDVRILESNAAAERLFNASSGAFFQHRAGHALHCLNAASDPQGCGYGEFCKDCIIRNAVVQACCGNQVIRRRARLELLHNDQTFEIFALISASPFQYQGNCRVLLVLEDIGEMAELRRIIPICSVCRKVRDEEKSWERIEAYFNEHWGVDFSHGLCPECHKKELEKIKQQFRKD